MKKKTEQSGMSQTKKRNIGIGVAVIVVIALAVGLSSLSIKPVTTSGPGTAEITFYAKDGSVIDAENVDVKIWAANYTSADNIDEFINDFENYVEDAYFEIEDGKLIYEIAQNISAILEIESGVYMHQYVILEPVSKDVFLNLIPDTVILYSLPKTINSTSGIIEGTAIIQLGITDEDLIDLENRNCSLPGYYDNYELGERLYLYLKFDNAANYTSAVLNISLGVTTLYEGDMYIRLNSDLIDKTSFDIELLSAEMGSPTVSLGYAPLNEFAEFSELIEVDILTLS